MYAVYFTRFNNGAVIKTRTVVNAAIASIMALQQGFDATVARCIKEGTLNSAHNDAYHFIKR